MPSQATRPPLVSMPAVWLRGNCPGPLCRDPVSGRRLLHTTRLPGPRADDGCHPQEGPDMTAADPVRVIADLFAAEGAGEYLGEAVTQAQHMLQAAALAEGAGAGPELVAAALLHDVGHFTGAVSGHQLMGGQDNRHGHQGADWLAQWFGPGVTEPVRLHVAANGTCAPWNPGTSAGCPRPPCTRCASRGGR